MTGAIRADSIDAALFIRAAYDTSTMLSRTYRAVIFAACVSVSGPRIAIADLYVQLFPLTGEIRLQNFGLTPIPFAFYSITSPSGALNSSSAVWKSITDNYDDSGNGFIDANNEWIKLSAPGSTKELSEGVIDNPGGVLPAMRSLSLGRVWNPHKVPFPDLLYDVRNPNGQPIGVFEELALDGDYVNNGMVDLVDYSAFWRPYFGSTTLLFGDGNINGVIDAADYVVWRDNLGKTLPFPPYAAGGGAASPLLIAQPLAVPESATGAILLTWAGLLSCMRECRLSRGRSKAKG